jgi:uncharacterized lipoprotein
MRTIATALAALSLAGGLAACGGQAQTRDGNSELEDQRLDERQQPPDAAGNGEEAAPTTDGQ